MAAMGESGRKASVFANIGKVKRMDTVTDDRGFERVVEVRQDSEQEQKRREVIDLLVAAGYFRARIQGLTPFDQVVGGLVWCITICNFDVDVDILFRENSNMGEKIALVEKIVAVLPKMKCPHIIQPHEIQGFNYIAMYPVVQWLVKQVVEYRAQMGDQNRAMSISQFDKQHQIPEANPTAPSVYANVDKLRRESVPQRKMKRVSNKKLKSEQALIQCVLMEFGRQGDIMQLLSEGGSGIDEEQQQAAVDQMLGGMTSGGVDGSGGGGGEFGPIRVSTKTLGNIVPEETTHRAMELQANFAREKLLAENSPAQQHARQVAALNKRIAQAEQALEQKAEQYMALNQTFKAKKGEVQTLQQQLDQVEASLGELKLLETEENKAILEKLATLVKQHEEIKQTESSFKAKCKEQMEILTKQVNDLNKKLSKSDRSEEVDPKTLALHQDIKSRVAKAEALVGKKTREIAGYQKLLDDTPSRAELSQYQKRFIELYNQMAFKYTETKHFYDLYNTLGDTLTFMEKEVTLMDSIHDNYESAMKSGGERKKQFIAHLESIQESTGLAKDRVFQKRATEKTKKDELENKMKELLDKQRQYHQTVKELQEEFKKM